MRSAKYHYVLRRELTFAACHMSGKRAENYLFDRSLLAKDLANKSPLLPQACNKLHGL